MLGLVKIFILTWAEIEPGSVTLPLSYAAPNSVLYTTEQYI